MRFVASAGSRSNRGMPALLAFIAVATVLRSPQASARPTEPDHKAKVIALATVAKLERQHVSQRRLDDEISQRAMKLFFESLDPMKLYFLQSDVDKFQAESTRLDDLVRMGQVGVAKRIFDVFLSRVSERTAVAHQLIDQEHDFGVDETMVRDPDKYDWCKSNDEANERLRKRIKYELLLQVVDDRPMDEAKTRIHKRYRSTEHRLMQTDNDELLEIFLSAITMSFDPHSSYMSPRTLNDFIIQMRLELDGIGASLQSEYGETIVRQIIPGGAAAKDGKLQVDDVIVGVGQGEEGPIEDVTDMKLTDVVQKIRGKPGTIVRLEVRSGEGSELKVLGITRARIELKDSEARAAILQRGPRGENLDKDADKLAGEPGEEPKESTGQVIEQTQPDGEALRIGVISLPSFYMDMEGRREHNDDYKSTSRDVRRLLEDFKKQAVDLVIVDLRFNGGGSLLEAVETTGLFIDQGPVVQVKGTSGRTEAQPDTDPGAVWAGPLMVLVNKFSASASEIFAGAIQDYGRGVVVGDQSTHGKGTVQQLDELGRLVSPINPPNYGALKLTIQKFYRPGGDSTQNRGVVADIELPSQMSQWEGIGEADLDYALKFDRVSPLPHDNYQFARPTVIEELRRRSKERCESNDYFIAERKRTERYLQRKNDPTITLNKEKFLAERKELNTEKEQEDLFEDLQSNDRPVYPDTPYNSEVVAIALDYLKLLGDSRLAVR